MKLSSRERQRQIMEVSLGIIKDGGIQSLTIKTISAKIGISEQAIYRHFESKHHILISIIDYFEECFKEVFKKPERPVSPLEQIKLMTSAHLQYFAGHPAVAAVIFSEEIFQNHSELAAAVRKSLDKRVENLTTLIDKGQQNGEINNAISAENLALVLLGTMRLLITRWRLSGFTFDVEEKGKTIVADVLTLLHQQNHTKLKTG